MPTEEYKSMTAKQLADAISRFISDNGHSNKVELRWMASHMTGTLTMFGEFISARGLGPELRKLVNDFRTKEILTEIDSKQREIVKLDHEVRRLKSA